MLFFIKDVLKKPINEGSIAKTKDMKKEEQEVIVENLRKKRSIQDARLENLRRNIVQSQHLNFFSLDKRIQNIKYENLQIL